MSIKSAICEILLAAWMLGDITVVLIIATVAAFQ
jgi:hypothetical protein